MAEKSKARQPGMHTLNALPMDGKEDFLEMARAAIEAMREPTEDMLQAAKENDMKYVYETSPPEEYWPLMIDAAIKD